MAGKEIDPLTGLETTGHEWDGVKELNTPLPKWWLYVFYATILFSVVYCILYPAWPLGTASYTKGVLGYSSRAELVDQMAQVREGRGTWLAQFEDLPVEEVAENPDLLRFAMAGGRYIFADNCAPCHGAGGQGAPGYPVLADDDWLWGGSLDAIMTTINYGVRSNDDARFSEMVAYGAEEILDDAQISAVADYVLSLSGQGTANDQGATIFADECTACHGEDGRGIPDLGAPNLTDAIWLYGGKKRDVVQQINDPRHGVMPPWVGRLSEVEIKQVTIYVHSLGGGQ